MVAEKFFSMDPFIVSSPKNFYQVITFVGDFEGRFFFPLIQIFVTGKSEEIYYKVFNNISSLLKKQTFTIRWEKCHIDFEKALNNSFAKTFGGVQKINCFFHFVQILWRKLSQLGFRKKNKIKTGKKLESIILSSISFEIKFRKAVLYLLLDKEYINVENDAEKFFIKFYLKNWINYKHTWFNGDFQRTNNAIEAHHKQLNSAFDYPKPHISTFINVVKNFERKYFEKTKNAM